MHRQGPLLVRGNEMSTNWPDPWVDQFPDGFKKMQLVEYLGWQKGHKLGTPLAREIIADSHWLYDRPTETLLEIKCYHEITATWIYLLRKGKDYDGIDEGYVNEHMGFWLSSVSHHNIYVGKGFKPTAQERMAFKHFNFVDNS